MNESRNPNLVKYLTVLTVDPGTISVAQTDTIISAVMIQTCFSVVENSSQVGPSVRAVTAVMLAEEVEEKWGIKRADI